MPFMSIFTRETEKKCKQDSFDRKAVSSGWNAHRRVQLLSFYGQGFALIYYKIKILQKNRKQFTKYIRRVRWELKSELINRSD